jgi:hypothetical protein
VIGSAGVRDGCKGLRDLQDEDVGLERNQAVREVGLGNRVAAQNIGCLRVAGDWNQAVYRWALK